MNPTYASFVTYIELDMSLLNYITLSYLLTFFPKYFFIYCTHLTSHLLRSLTAIRPYLLR